MKNFKLIYLLIAAAFFSACDKDDYLDVEPYEVILLETVDDFRLLIDQRGGGDSKKSVGREPLYEIDLVMSDDVMVPDGNLGTYFETGNYRYGNALIWEEHFASAEEDDTDYEYIYNQLLIANTIIEKMGNAEVTGDDELRQQLIAEAKVHRAAAHFAAVNLYSAQYDPATAASDLGVVIKTSTEKGASIRGTVQEAYDIILQDLNEAIASNTMENEVPILNWRASNVGALGLLAKVYLQIGDYTNALSTADQCLQIHSTLLDYNFLGNLPNSSQNPEVLLAKSPIRSLPTDIRVSTDLLDMYDADDLRQAVRFWVYPDRTIYYSGGRDYNNTMTVGPGVAEMYLIRAESNARLGSGDPIADLNTLRATRYATGTYVDLVAGDFTDNDALINFIMDERRRELPFSGVRLFDLKRYNALHNANISITRTIDGETTTLEPNSNRWIVPIARKYLNQADGLVQSER